MPDEQPVTTTPFPEGRQIDRLRRVNMMMMISLCKMAMSLLDHQDKRSPAGWAQPKGGLTGWKTGGPAVAGNKLAHTNVGEKHHFLDFLLADFGGLPAFFVGGPAFFVFTALVLTAFFTDLAFDFDLLAVFSGTAAADRA